MAEPRPADSFEELEALIRSAGNALQTSVDLRPRVLEAARQRRDCLSFQGLLQQAAILLLIGGLMSAVVAEPWGRAADHEAALGLGASLTSTDTTVSTGDPGWSMVESFTKVRRRQADLFRFDL
jgi:hypothetical protein